VLRCDASRTAGRLADPLAELAVRVTAGAEFEVARQALDELLARLALLDREPVTTDARPAACHATGWFVVGKHVVWIGSASPIEASCDCPDFRKASLGACTHVLSVLQDADDALGVSVCDRPILRWNPIRPLSGLGDWLERVWWDPADARPDRSGRVQSRRVLEDPIRRRRLIGVLHEACARPRFADPALQALVEREWALDGTAVEPEEVERRLGELRLPLFEYQREGVTRFFWSGRLLLGDDMGLGKTAQAIAIGHTLLATNRIRRVAVIVPSPLKWQWAQEWSRFSAQRPRVIEGTPTQRRVAYQADEGILILSYEQLRRDRSHVQRFDPELVILDEAQRIKNAPTQTAKAVKELVPRWRLALTGTPIENRIEDLASIVEWIDDMALEPRWRLMPWHTIRVDGAREAAGMHDLGTLRARISKYFIRRVRADVLRQLPARRDTNIPVPLTPAQHRSHRTFDLLVLALLEQVKRRPLTREEFLQLMRLLTEQRMICNGLALRSFTECWPMIQNEPTTPKLLAELSSPKLDVLVELLSSIAIDQGRKVVVFSQWRRMLQLAEWSTRGLLDDASVRGMYFSGQESATRRTANLVRFHDLPDFRVLWATDAGALGLNLQRAASCCINLDLPWNPAVLEQRIGRVYRLGQTEPVDVYNLIGTGGIEERIARLIGNKRTLFDELFDGTADAISFGGASSSKLAGIMSVARDAADRARIDHPESRDVGAAV